jgi:cytoskeletal protein CcmA (bactofilin family)
MFGKKSSPAEASMAKERFATIIGEHTTIKGDIELADGIRIDGLLEGNASRLPEAHLAVVVGQSGTVRGNIDASRVVIAGTVHGAIRAQDDVELQPTAVVQGDVQCKSLRVAHGAQLVGRILTCEQPAASPKPMLVVDQSDSAKLAQKKA